MGHREMVAFWDKGWRQQGERKSGGWGVASRGRKMPLSLLVLAHLASFPEEFVFTPLNKNWLVLVPPGKNRQIQEYLCLQGIWRPSPQPPDPWRFLVPRLLLGVLLLPQSPGFLGNFIPISTLQIPWGSQCPQLPRLRICLPVAWATG